MTALTPPSDPTPPDREPAASVKLTIFADFTCPYSYITEGAIGLIESPPLEIDSRAFELYPEPAAVDPIAITDAERETLAPLAAEVGLHLGIPEVRPRTRKAHEAARFAREKGLEMEMRRAIYHAYWSEGLDIGRIDVLARLARDLGMDGEELRIALDIDRLTPAVQHDEQTAQRLRIPGTPTIYVGTGPRARVIAGAYRIDELRRFIEEWSTNESRDDSPDDV